jgi:hypothetical protein
VVGGKWVAICSNDVVDENNFVISIDNSPFHQNSIVLRCDYYADTGHLNSFGCNSCDNRMCPHDGVSLVNGISQDNLISLPMSSDSKSEQHEYSAADIFDAREKCKSKVDKYWRLLEHY